VKILIVNNLYSPNVLGGAEASIQVLAEALARAGSEVAVVATAAEAAAPFEQNGVRVLTLPPANVEWPFTQRHRHPLKRKLWHLLDTYNPLMEKRLGNLIAAESPDIVHTNNLQGVSVAAWRAAARSGVPILHTLRDYYLTCARSNRFRDGSNCEQTCLSCKPFAALRRQQSAAVGGVVGVSRFILDAHVRLGFFPRARFSGAIRNSCVVAERRAAKTTSDLVFGYLGRIDPAKGIDVLVGAFAARTDANWQLMLAGTGPEDLLAELRRQAAAALHPERIQFVGHQDATSFLSRIDVLVVPSRWHEPMARAAIEAQAHGVAVIVSQRGGLPELVDDATGFVFQPDDPTSLPALITRLLDNPQQARDRAVAAHERQRQYTPEQQAREYLAAYRAVIASA